MKLHDEVVAHIAQLVQLAILEGTDIVDQFRMIELENVDGLLHLNKDYKENFDSNIKKLVEKASSGELLNWGPDELQIKRYV